MNNVIIVGTLNNSEEIKMFGENNTEILEFKVEGIKCKAFGKLATEIKNMKGIVVVNGEITLRDYTNKDGKTFPIQEIVIKKAKGLEKPVDNWGSPKEVVIDPDELPFY